MGILADGDGLIGCSGGAGAERRGLGGQCDSCLSQISG